MHVNRTNMMHATGKGISGYMRTVRALASLLVHAVCQVPRVRIKNFSTLGKTQKENVKGRRLLRLAHASARPVRDSASVSWTATPGAK